MSLEMCRQEVDRTDPSGIPEFTGDLGLLEKDAAALRKDAAAIRKTGTDVNSSFQGLSGFYDAPEAEQLFATTKPVADRADGFAGDLEKAAKALAEYAAEADPIVRELRGPKAQATAFVASVEGEDGWRNDKDKAARNNALVQEVNVAVARFHDAERRAASKISALVGGTQWVAGDPTAEKQKANAYGLSVEDMKQATDTPWGKAVEPPRDWLESLGNGIKTFVWDGFTDAWSGLGNVVGGVGLYVASPYE
ncbi:hypothetical protein [Streptomyces gobiensis]|uniref:hypothetical protein n=1 Tax=Streptomyces gobiensis TaxID=2875706 RepID=UPI001E508F1E|nr:hypothetical protein [Streptomyces gobiensis]UGY92795.1 hypothetical protein test1122_14450 [Streptomyces gobiensis]